MTDPAAHLATISDAWAGNRQRPVDSYRAAQVVGVAGTLDAIHATEELAMDGLVTWVGCGDRYVVPTPLGLRISRRGEYRVREYAENIHGATNFAALHAMVRHWQLETDGIVFGDDSHPDLSAIPSSYLAGGGNFFVAEDVSTGFVLGFVGVRHDGGDRGALKRLAVRRVCRRRGIGTALVGGAVAWARGAGFCALTVTTGVRENALQIYEAAGFIMTRRGEEGRDHRLEMPLRPATRTDVVRPKP